MSNPFSPVDSDPPPTDWRSIEDLLDELVRIAKSNAPASDFYRELLARLLPAVGVRGGAIWTRSGKEAPRLAFQMNLVAGGEVPCQKLLADHQVAVKGMLDAGQARTLAPDGANRTEWLVLHPFDAGVQGVGAIELIDPGPLSLSGSRAHLHVLSAVGEVIEDFHRHREIGALRDAADHWHAYDQFAQRVHRSLDSEQTAFTLANEAHRVIECDRVSVLIATGRQQRVAAVSGVDTLDRRAKLLRALEHLATRVAACGQPVWYHEGLADLPDEILAPLDAYLAESHARAVAILPLVVPQTAREQTPSLVVGVLVAEQFQGLPSPETLRERTSAIARHSATALHNASTHTSMPFARLGRAFASLRNLLGAKHLPKTLSVMVLAATIVAALILIPADFNIESRGQLQPQSRREIFASVDGVVSELLVSPSKQVRAGEPLVVLRRAELDLEMRRVLGEMQTTEKQLAGIRAERLQDDPDRENRRQDPHALAAEEEELKVTLNGLIDQRKILDAQVHDLTLRSPIDGEALTWNMDQLLTARPVQRGQSLLTVADLAGPWILELDVADDRAGHVLAAREDSQHDLDVSFVLTSAPGQQYQGKVSRIAAATQLDAHQQPTVRMTVEFEKQDIAGLRPGATAIAHIHCGQRSLGYVWLHDLFDYVRSWWW